MNQPPFPLFTAETAAQKVRMAEDAWNTRDPGHVSPSSPLSELQSSGSSPLSFLQFMWSLTFNKLTYDGITRVRHSSRFHDLLQPVQI